MFDWGQVQANKLCRGQINSDVGIISMSTQKWA